jgi:hypothetical protein
MTEELLTAIEEAMPLRAALRIAEEKDAQSVTVDPTLWQLREQVRDAEKKVDDAFRRAMEYHIGDVLRKHEGKGEYP